jgi:hypothetical protein
LFFFSSAPALPGLGTLGSAEAAGAVNSDEETAEGDAATSPGDSGPPAMIYKGDFYL